MRKIRLCSFVLWFHLASAAQHTEISVQLNSGLLSFRGKSAVNSSFVIVTDGGGGNYTNDLYSKKAGIGIGIDFAIQRVTKKQFIYGIATGMELLKHVVPITNVFDATTIPATGDIRIHSHFINIKPIAGYRFLNKRSALDIAAGLDIAIGLADLYEVGSVTRSDNGEPVRVENDRAEIITDLRPGLQAKFSIQRYSLLAGYWLGQSNYYKNYTGSNEAYSRLFRLGFSYQLNRTRELKISENPKF